MILNFAKVLSVILTSHKIELKDLKDIRQIKLEEDHHSNMVMETFAISVVCVIGLENMELKQLITLED